MLLSPYLRGRRIARFPGPRDRAEQARAVVTAREWHDRVGSARLGELRAASSQAAEGLARVPPAG
jgi:hypothetical protein